MAGEPPKPSLPGRAADELESLDDDEVTPEAEWVSPLLGSSYGVDQAAFSSGEVVAKRYRVVRFVAEGGMGEVYEAEDLELGVRVALKLVQPEIADHPMALEQFKREVHLARQVTHPNVCRVFDVGHHERRGQRFTFLTMEMIAGETLQEYLSRRGRLTVAEARPLVVQMAEALAAAHAVGVIHRDFKPGNVILVDDPQRPQGRRAVVTDFGVAHGKVTTTLAPEGFQATSGSPAYMAPEQEAGAPVSCRADVYSLGAVMYQMVTGGLPCRGGSGLVPPRRRAPIGPVWDRVILRCLEPEPARRYAGTREVVRALGDLPTRRRALPWALALGVALLLAGGLWVAERRSSRVARPARRVVAVVGFRNLSGRAESAWMSTALAEMLAGELGVTERMGLVPSERVAAAKVDLALPEAPSYSPEALGRLRATLGADLVVCGAYLALGPATGSGQAGTLRLDLRVQDTATGETVFTLAETSAGDRLAELAVTVAGGLRSHLGLGGLTSTEAGAARATRSTAPLANQRYAEGLARLGRYDTVTARQLFEQAVSADPSYALAHAALAGAWRELGHDGETLAEAKRAFDGASRLPRREKLSIEGQYREAAREWDKAAAIYRALATFFPDELDHRLKLIEVLIPAGRAPEALPVVDAMRGTGDDPRVDLAEADVAAALTDHRGAAVAAERALEKGRRLRAQLVAAQAWLRIARARRNLGRLDGAIEAAEEARRIFQAAGDRERMVRALNVFGLVAIDRGELDQAARTFRQILQISDAMGARRPHATALNNLAMVELEAGRLAEAARLAGEAIAEARSVDRRGLPYAMLTQASIFAEQGKLARAATATRAAQAEIEQVGQKGHAAVALAQLASVLHGQAAIGEALTAAEQALAVARANQQGHALGDVLHVLGELRRARGDWELAAAQHGEALTLRAQQGNLRAAARSRLALAELTLDRGEALDTRRREEIEKATSDGPADDRARAWAVLGRAALAAHDREVAGRAIAALRVLAAKSERPALRGEAALLEAALDLESGQAPRAVSRLAAVVPGELALLGMRRDTLVTQARRLLAETKRR